MKIIIAPDKFKGSLTSMEICESIRTGLLQANPDAEIELLPMADGGDGFAAVMKYYLNTQTIPCITVDPLMRESNTSYEWDGANKTAIIELAAAAGLVLLNADEQNPLHTSTYGTGLMIKHALDNGAQKIVLGIGGSATNDAGIGILAALGFVFRDGNNKILPPRGECLSLIKTIEIPLHVHQAVFLIACDVDNVLFGKEGAAVVYAPQKGADEKEVEILDEGLKHFAALILAQTGKDIASFPGSGAAGGVAAGLAAFFNIQLQNGASVVIKESQVQKRLPGTDMIITGEGRLDQQSVRGKVVAGIAAAANQYNIPVIAICGENVLSEDDIIAAGLSKVYPLVNENISKEYAMRNATSLISANAALIMNKCIR